MDEFDVIIIGSGAAGYSTADWLYKYGIDKVAIIAENRLLGTSRNAGSDKQTYYKLSMACADKDSVYDMARSLYDGGAMNGDIALIEAVNSVRCFMRLVEYGAPFPTNEYGEYVGYKTDHDNSARATSCGPLTSKYMTEILEKKAIANGTRILDNMQVARIIMDNDHVCGVVVLDEKGEINVIKTNNVIMATGGEASIYRDSVYPVGQSGNTSLGVNIGAQLHNFQEWQYGMASTKFRWNVSGSYQQVIPRYVSVDENDIEREFLLEHYDNACEAYDNVFLKGYQWPFDCQKRERSSKIDLLVHGEILNGRKVYLDFRANPQGYDFDKLNNETKDYLIKTGATQNTPYERLRALNAKAIDIYASHGINLSSEKLEIAICAQHNNGGLGVDTDYQTNVKGLFAVGEVAGTFGVYRQGGSALNSTQVSGLRVAQYLAKNTPNSQYITNYSRYIEEEKDFINKHLSDKDNTLAVTNYFRALMSDYAGVCRDYERIQGISDELGEYLSGEKPVTISNIECAKRLYKCYDMLKCDYLLCKTILSSISRVGSRGGSLSTRKGEALSENVEYRDKITVTFGEKVTYIDRKPIPNGENNFEKLLSKGVL